MSNFMDKVTNFLGLGGEEGIEEEVPVMPAEREEARMSSKKNKVVNIHTTTQLKVVIIQPTSYADSQEIADHLKSKKPVVVNLEKLDKEIAIKIVNFLSGAVYALDGSMQKVSNGIILLAPYNVGIMGDFGEELKMHGLFDNE
ncbi:MAG: cell division protein SepF [Ruminococcaceae bacterium]|nr:cell division protein SepF [Oscillospiraceae bacterium]